MACRLGPGRFSIRIMVAAPFDFVTAVARDRDLVGKEARRSVGDAFFQALAGGPVPTVSAG